MSFTLTDLKGFTKVAGVGIEEDQLAKQVPILRGTLRHCRRVRDIELSLTEPFIEPATTQWIEEATEK